MSHSILNQPERLSSQLVYTGKGNPCPVCGDTKKQCRLTGQTVNCSQKSGEVDGFWNNGPAQNERWTMYRPKESRDNRSAAPPMPADARHEWYSRILGQLVLTDSDRADLERRGFSPTAIDRIGFKSVGQWQLLPFEMPHNLPGVGKHPSSLVVGEPGYLCPCRDSQGRINGFQIRTQDSQNKYRWLTSGKASPQIVSFHCAEFGGPPLSVCTPDRQYPAKTDLPVALAEGTGPKPWRAAELLQMNVVGAAGGQFKASKLQLKAELEALGAVPGSLVTCFPDAGDKMNRSNVPERWKKVFDLLKEWGYQVQVWDSPAAKGDGPDIDEISPDSIDALSYVEPEEWLAEAAKLAETEIASPPEIDPLDAEDLRAAAAAAIKNDCILWDVDISKTLPHHAKIIQGIADYFHQPAIISKWIFRAVCSGLLPRTAKVSANPNNEHPERLLFSGVALGPSGIAKSGHLKKFTAPLDELNEKWEREQKILDEKHRQDVLSWEFRKNAHGKKSPFLEKEPERESPAISRVASISGLDTLELIAEINRELKDYQCSILSDELTGLISGLKEGYSKHSGVVKLLHLLDGSSFERGTKSGSKVKKAKDSGFPVMGMSQPRSWRQAMAEADGSQGNGIKGRIPTLIMNPDAPLPDDTKPSTVFSGDLLPTYKNLASYGCGCELQIDDDGRAIYREWMLWLDSRKFGYPEDSDERSLLAKRKRPVLVGAAIDWLATCAAPEFQSDRPRHIVPAGYIQAMVDEMMEVVEAELRYMASNRDEDVKTAAPAIYAKLVKTHGVGTELTCTQASKSFDKVKGHGEKNWNYPKMAEMQPELDEMQAAGLVEIKVGRNTRIRILALPEKKSETVPQTLEEQWAAAAIACRSLDEWQDVLGKVNETHEKIVNYLISEDQVDAIDHITFLERAATKVA